MEILIDGKKVRSESDFHRELATAVCVEAFYGCNLDALWDLLSASVERPILLTWTNSQESRTDMGERFEKIVEILERVKQQDEKFGWSERFIYKLD
jgi:ribonuclease inhibitor